jgi:hypothetical protein
MRFTSIKDKVMNWGEKTTIHALPIVFESRHIVVKLIAFVLFVVSFCLCAQNMISNLITFLSYPVDTVLVVTRETNTIFPAVSFCIVQVCDLKNYSYVPFFNMTWFQTESANAFDFSISTFADTVKKNFLTNYNKSLLLSATNNAMSPASKFNISISDILISCKYGDDDCYESDFVFFQVS